MKKYLFIIGLLMGFRVFAQDTNRVYFIDNPANVLLVKANHRVGSFAKSHRLSNVASGMPEGFDTNFNKVMKDIVYKYSWSDYLPDSVLSIFDSYFLKKIDSTQDEYFIFYFKNESKSREGYFKNGKKDGIWKEWYTNGVKRAEGRYYKGYKIGNWQSWYPSGKLYSEQNFISDTSLIGNSTEISRYLQKQHADIGSFLLLYDWKGGLRSGISKWYFPNGQVGSEEKWDIALVSVKQWNEDGKKVRNSYIDNNYRLLKSIPEFDGNIKSYFVRKLKIPKAKRKEFKDIKVKFIVTDKGNIQDIKVIYPKDSNVEMAITKVLESTEGKWAIAKEHNIPKDVEYNLTINF